MLGGLALAVAAVAQPPPVTTVIELESIATPAFRAQGVAVRLTWDGENRLQATLSAAAVAIGDTLRLRDVDLTCARAEYADGVIRCPSGALRAALDDRLTVDLPAALTIDRAADRIDVRIAAPAVAGGGLAVVMTGVTARWRADIMASGIDLAMARPWLESRGLWPEGYGGETGRIDLDIGVTGGAGGAAEAEATLIGSGVAVSGTHIVDQADLRLVLRLAREQAGYRFDGSATLDKGAVYFEPGFTVGDFRPGVTLEVEDQPVRLAANGSYEPATDRLLLERATFEQPRVATLGLSGELAPGAETPWRAIAVDIVAVDLRAFNERHLRSLCSHIDVLCGLEVEGEVGGRLAIGADGVGDVDLEFAGIHVDDDRRRFRLADLNGNLAISAGAAEKSSALTWQGAGLYRLDFGGGAIKAGSRQRGFTVSEWSDLRVLDGLLKLDALEVKDVGSAGMSVTMEGALTPLSLPDFCQALGWPIMAGKLAGVIPRLTYQHGSLTLDGDLVMRMFDGGVTIRGLRIDDLFGRAPILTTDVDVAAIDLEQLTQAFSFGKIQGRLQGAVHKLRLDDWEPTYFEARFETPPDDDSRHRISQRAVDNLSALGSGGITGALSKGFLNVFKEYSYDRLGLSCRLYNGVCEMDGVAPAPGGFYIVTRGGLLPPWIDVIGTGRAVPWSDLVYGFREIASREMRIQ